MSDQPFDMPPVSAGFDARGAWVLRRLMTDLDLTAEQAAGIVGNLGGESGLKAVQEISPIAGRGGFGWAQWTASRRVAFEHWCADHDLDVTSDEANYGYLLTELQGEQAHPLEQVKKCSALDAATYTFCVYFERPADPEGGMPARLAFAKRALAAAARMAPAPQVPAIPQPQVEVIPPHVQRPTLHAPQQPRPHQPAFITAPSAVHIAATGSSSVVAYALVVTVAYVLSLYGIQVPEFLQNAWLATLFVVGGWFAHTRLFKAMELDAGDAP